MQCAAINFNGNKGHSFLKPMAGKKELGEIVVGCAVGVLNDMDWDLDLSSIRNKVWKMM